MFCSKWCVQAVCRVYESMQSIRFIIWIPLFIVAYDSTMQLWCSQSSNCVHHVSFVPKHLSGSPLLWLTWAWSLFITFFLQRSTNITISWNHLSFSSPLTSHRAIHSSIPFVDLHHHLLVDERRNYFIIEHRNLIFTSFKYLSSNTGKIDPGSTHSLFHAICCSARIPGGILPSPR